MSVLFSINITRKEKYSKLVVSFVSFVVVCECDVKLLHAKCVTWIDEVVLSFYLLLFHFTDVGVIR